MVTFHVGYGSASWDMLMRASEPAGYAYAVAILSPRYQS